jgi:hypothetical protein
MAVAVPPTNKPANLQRRSSTAATLTIPSRTGHRRILRDFFVKASASGYCDVAVGNVTLFRLYDNLSQAVLVSSLDKKFRDLGFLRFMAQFIPDFPFPNASEDEDISIVRSASPTQIDAYFEDVTEGDVRTKTVVGGSMSLRHFMPVYLENSGDIKASGEFNFDYLDMPAGLNPFIEGSEIVTASRRIPSGQRYVVYAIAGDFPKNYSSKVTRVYIRDEQIMLFTSENAEGLVADPDLGNELSLSLSPPKIFLLPTPYTFEPNRIFTFKGYASHDGTHDLSANTQKLILLGVREYIV